MTSSLRPSDVALVLGDAIIALDAGDVALARDIAFLLRERLLGEIVLEEREGIAEVLGVEAVSH